MTELRIYERQACEIRKTGIHSLNFSLKSEETMIASAPVENLTFETALSELETIVRGLEKGDTPLEESIAAYERGVALKTHCEKKLREAQAKIEKIVVRNDGSIAAEPFGEDA